MRKSKQQSRSTLTNAKTLSVAVLVLCGLVFGWSLSGVNSQETTAPSTPTPEVAPVSPQEFKHPEAQFHAGMREELATNLREITRTLAQVNPEDTQLVQILKADQNAIIEQIKGIDAQIKALEAAAAASPVMPGNAGNPNLDIPLTDYRTPNVPGAMNPNLVPPYAATPQNPANRALAYDPQRAANEAAEARSKQVLETVKQLRELGLNEHADELLKQHEAEEKARKEMLEANMNMTPRYDAALGTPELPQRYTPPMGATPTMPGTLAPNTLTPAGQNGLWGAPPAREVVELRETVMGLRTEIEQMRAEIKSLETQIRLLNQNILLQQGR